MSKHIMPILNYKQAAQAVAACLRAKRTALLIGSPGIGKTALVRDASAAISLPCYDFIASNLDPTDIAGLPYRGPDGRVHREPFPEILKCIEAPGVLFGDEATTMPKSVEGPFLRLALERNAGGRDLHPDSRVILACNPPEQAPGGIELSAAMINRIVPLHYAPHGEEVRNYFNGEPVKAEPSVIGDEQFDEQFRVEKADFAATLAADPSLIVMDPPRASIDAGEPWASPRGWETGLACYAANGGRDDEIGFALLAGAVGPHAAGAYQAIRKLRVHLPTVDQIVTHPSEAKVPTAVDQQIAALGVLSRVSDRDVWAAWTYADRLTPEIGAACARVLMNKAPQGASKHATLGRAAQVKLLAKIKKATS